MTILFSASVIVMPHKTDECNSRCGSRGEQEMSMVCLFSRHSGKVDLRIEKTEKKKRRQKNFSSFA